MGEDIITPEALDIAVSAYKESALVMARTLSGRYSEIVCKRCNGPQRVVSSMTTLGKHLMDKRVVKYQCEHCYYRQSRTFHDVKFTIQSSTGGELKEIWKEINEKLVDLTKSNSKVELSRKINGSIKTKPK